MTKFKSSIYFFLVLYVQQEEVEVIGDDDDKLVDHDFRSGLVCSALMSEMFLLTIKRNTAFHLDMA